MCRHEALKSVKSDSSPIHWQYGAIARLPKGASIEPLLYGGYSSISLGYIGLYSPLELMMAVLQYLPAGLCLAWSYIRGDTIFAPIVIHAAVNYITIRGL